MTDTQETVHLRGGTRDGKVMEIIVQDDGSLRRWTSFIDPEEFYQEAEVKDEDGYPYFDYAAGLKGPLDD